jgi:hypothetical protein
LIQDAALPDVPNWTKDLLGTLDIFDIGGLANATDLKKPPAEEKNSPLTSLGSIFRNSI